MQIVCHGNGKSSLADFIFSATCSNALHEYTNITFPQPALLAQCGNPLDKFEMINNGKVNRMETILNLAEKRAHGQSPNLTQGTASGNTKSANFTDRLLIVMDNLIYALIEELKDKLEAPSIGDVVRQAVRAYAIELAGEGSVTEDVGFSEESYTGSLKKLNIRIPSRTKERLEFLKGETGTSYTAIIFGGLGILARSTDEQESVLQTLTEKESRYVDIHSKNVSLVSDRSDTKKAIMV